MRQAVTFEKVFHRTKFLAFEFTGMFHESFKNQFNWNLKLKHTVKLTLTFKRQFHKMVKHIQTIRRQSADELFECV